MTILYQGNKIRHHRWSLWMIIRNGMWRKSWIPGYTATGCSTWLNGLDLTGLTGSLPRALINWKQSTDSISVTLKSQDHFLRMMTRASVNLRDFGYKGGVMSRCTLLSVLMRTDVGTLTLLLVMLPIYALSSALTILRCTVSVSYVKGSYVEETWCL